MGNDSSMVADDVERLFVERCTWDDCSADELSARIVNADPAVDVHAFKRVAVNLRASLHIPIDECVYHLLGAISFIVDGERR